MKAPLAGRVALVTGASSGIGRATAEAFVRAGAHVALLARRVEPLEAAAAALGERALPVAADVGDPVSVRRAFEVVSARFGHLDVLVNNAAVGRLDAVAQASDEDLRLQVETNFLGAVHCIRCATPLLESRRGLIVNVSSDSVARPYPGLVVYAATKGALEVLTLGLRRELRDRGIRVGLVRAGPTATEFAREWDPERARGAFARWRAEGDLDPERVVSPELVASAILAWVCEPTSDLVEVG
ncbi:MAG: SDR family NAD(P)-dependent oxidoreductase [Proteobacteria bacterium]|nr:SDR family NAD(P)-dependent oxidoreductase [Pseudomonadota bacterium]